MKKTFILSIIFLIISIIGRAQNQIDIYESTMKIVAMGTEEYLCGFAEGDQLVFNFEEVNGKELKELEIVELPSSSKFLDYKTTKVVNKTLSVSKTAIYKFRFSNSAISGRICKVKIQRIPASDATKNFNTSVYTKTVYDTTYIPTQERFLIKSDTSAISVVDQIAKVSSQTAMNGNSNKTVVDFSLPDGTISWSYYIGVGTEGKEAFQAATDKFLPEATKFAATIPGYGTMAALALTGINYFSKVQGADNVKYFFITNGDNVILFNSNQQFYQYKQGDVVNDASKMTKPLDGKVYLGLLNDNISTAIEVIIKISAITVNQVWETRIVQKSNITSRQELYLKN
jgi:hypothetical protein